MLAGGIVTNLFLYLNNLNLKVTVIIFNKNVYIPFFDKNSIT